MHTIAVVIPEEPFVVILTCADTVAAVLSTGPARQTRSVELVEWFCAKT